MHALVLIQTQRSAQGLYLEQCPKHCSFFMRAKGAYSERGCGSSTPELSPYVEALNIGTAVTLFVAC